jgi:hypothetical protein
MQRNEDIPLRLRMWKWIVNEKKKHANYLMGVLFVKWHKIDMHDRKLYANDDKKILDAFWLCMPTEPIMDVLDYICAEMQHYKVLIMEIFLCRFVLLLSFKNNKMGYFEICKYKRYKIQSFGAT